MSKVKIQCTSCSKQYRTEHPEIVIRFCKNCNRESEFELVTKKPVIKKGAWFDIICLKCRSMGHVQSIPSKCPRCGQRFQRHSENQTLTDVIFNAIVGSDKEKGYMKVDANPRYGGLFFWTVPKDVYGDDADPFIGDSARVRQPDVYMGQGASRTDDIKPVIFGQGTKNKRFIK